MLRRKAKGDRIVRKYILWEWFLTKCFGAITLWHFLIGINTNQIQAWTPLNTKADIWIYYKIQVYKQIWLKFYGNNIKTNEGIQNILLIKQYVHNKI